MEIDGVLYRETCCIGRHGVYGNMLYRETCCGISEGNECDALHTKVVLALHGEGYSTVYKRTHVVVIETYMW